MRRLLVLLLVASVPACALFQPAEIGHKFSVFFTERSAALDAPAGAVIANAAALANQFPAFPVTVAGYSGAGGAAQAELDLAGRRAQAVETRLIADGVAQSRITRAVHAPITYPATPLESHRVDISIGSP